MLPGLKSLSSSEVPLELHLVTDLNAAKSSPLLGELRARSISVCKLRLDPMVVQATWPRVGQCDLVVVPSLPSVKKLVKSPNRAVEGIRGGRLFLPIRCRRIRELAPGCGSVTTWRPASARALADPKSALETITAGQSIIARRFSPQRIAQRWEAVLEQLVECTCM